MNLSEEENLFYTQISRILAANMKAFKRITIVCFKRWVLRCLGQDFQIEYVRTQDFADKQERYD